MSVKFKEARKLALLSQKDVALKLSTTEATISRYESGKIKPDPDTLIALAKIFNCSTDYLLGIDSTPTQQQLNVYSTVHSSTQSVHSAQDEELIRKFNMLDERDQEDVMDDIDRKLERQERRFAEEGKRA